MARFYTDVSIHKNEILLRGYEDGRPIKDQVDYKPYVFLPSSKKTEFRTLQGQHVEKKTFRSIKDANDFIRRYKDVDNFSIFGLTNFEYLYIYDQYKGDIEFDPSLISVVVLDIETDSRGGWPNIAAADKAITAITIRRKGKSISFGCKYYKPSNPDVQYVLCEDEKQLLENFLYYWEKWSPDVITGWNIEAFDVPYIVNRISRVLSVNAAKRLSPWQQLTKRKVEIRGKEVEMFTPVGIQVLDYMQVYKKFSFKTQESYTLEYIAQQELGQGKLDYSEWGTLADLYDKSFETYMDYNIIDCELVERLESKKGMLKQIFVTAYKAKVNFSDMFATIRPWDGLAHDFLMNKNIVVPGTMERSKIEFSGGYVKPVNPSLHGWIVSFDVTSMYPHIIMTWNISPETLIKKLDSMSIERILDGGLEDLEDYLQQNNVSIAANMCTYRKDKHGFLAQIMLEIFNQRALYKKRKIEAEKRAEVEGSTEEIVREIESCDTMQQALKILMNSGYGAIANEWFRYFEINNAEAITTTGRLIIRWVEKKINQYMNKILSTNNVDYVIAIDTDAVYVNVDQLRVMLVGKDASVEKTIEALDKFCKQVIQKKLEVWFDQLGHMCNVYEQKIEMKREVIADRAVWKGAKNYIVSMWDKEGVRYHSPKLKIMGLRAIKASTPAVCRDAIKHAFELFMQNKQDEFYDHIAKFAERFPSLEFEDVASATSVKTLDNYVRGDSYIKGTPASIRGAINYNRLLRSLNLDAIYPSIYQGDKVRFAYLKMPNPTGDNVIAIPTSIHMPKEFQLEGYIDYTVQYEKVFAHTVLTIVEIAYWGLQARATLDEFFS